MAEARSSATWLWAGVAGILVLGFMVWLTMTSEPSVVAEVQEDTAPPAPSAPPAPAAEVVTAQQFEDSLETYAGREVALADVIVASKMGSQILWVELPSGATFPVKAEPAAAEGVTPESRVTVTGRVEEKTAAVLDAWEGAGVLEGPEQRTQAESGTYYIEATAIRPSGDGSE